MRLLDSAFKYTPSTSTNVVSTWRKFGYRPTTEAERTARQRRASSPPPGSNAVASLPAKRKTLGPALRLTTVKK